MQRPTTARGTSRPPIRPATEGAEAAASTAAHRQRGSVTPLVIGMVFCLLLLGAGVTAATSAFIARSNLQHVCDGAAAAAADAAARVTLTGASSGWSTAADAATDAAAHYVENRRAVAEVAAEVGDASVGLSCTGTAPITFGALFGSPTLTLTVHAIGHTVLSPT